MNNNNNNNKQPVILVVDDDMAMRLLMREALENTGCEVKEATNGLEALSLFDQEHPALVLMDVQMPKMDGFKACSMIRQLSGGKDVTIVMVTGLEDISSIQKAYEAGATDFITKPVNWPILEYRVRYLLRAREAFISLRENEKKLAQAQHIARLGNWNFNIKNSTINLSNEVYRIFDIVPKNNKISYNTFFNIVHPEDKRCVKDAFKKALHNAASCSIDFRIIISNKKERTLYGQAEVVVNKTGKAVSIHGIIQDITDRKKAEEKIKLLANYDILTGLPNRQMFKEYAHRELKIANRSNKQVALIYLDLDRFKYINDTLGHNAGDEVLKIIAKQLLESFRNSDILASATEAEPEEAKLSRLGGDEFIVLIAGLRHIKHAAKVANRALKSLSKPIKINNQELYITGSVGIAVYPTDGMELNTLLKNADTAMYHAKDIGGNTYQFYSKSMNVRTLEMLGMEAQLQKALDKKEFVLYYQPQIEIKNKKIVGMEALIRWINPEMGLVAPDKFIPIVEETGLIIPIGKWVLQHACEQAVIWQQQGLIPFCIAVNLSSHQFRQKNLIDYVKQILFTTGLDPCYLELELTESAIMQDVEKAEQTLKVLKSIGLKLAIDDFGTGYSSMNYLKRFDVDTLKIDRSFVRDVTNNPNDVGIIKAIIALANSLGMDTVAEGVETKEQLEFLTLQKCNIIQGYFFSKPLPAKQIPEFIKTFKYI